MEKSLVKKIFQQAKAARELHEDEISEAYKFTFPNRDIWRVQEGDTDRTKLFDSTAADGTQNLVSTILTLLIPQNQQWAYVDVRDEIKPQVAPDVRRMLDMANKVVFKTIRDSGFYVAASEALTDCVIAGTGAITMVETDQGIDFLAIPTHQLYFLENYKGEVDTVFRQHHLTAQYLIEKYGADAVGDGVQNLAKSNPHGKVKILECCMKAPGDKEMMYRVYLEDKMTLLEEKVSPAQMFIVFRFGKTLGSIWGESPVRQALPHIRVANEATQLIMTQSAWAGLGAWQTDGSESTVNFANMKIEPGDVITVDSMLQPIPFPGNFQITFQTVEDQRAKVRTMLFNDAIIPPQESQQMTAFEVQVRQSEFFRRIGPYGLRLEIEFLRPIIKNLIKRLQLRGELPEFINNNQEFEIVVNSAVKKGIGMSEIQRDIQLLQIVSQLGPEAVAQVDIQALARKILRDGDMSPEVLLDPEAVQERLQQQQQAQMLAQAAQSLQAQDPRMSVQPSSPQPDIE